MRPTKNNLTCGHSGTYGEDSDGNTFCDSCIADKDRQTMIDKGHSKNLPLYLSESKDGTWSVSNWTGSLSFRCGFPKISRHNIAHYRYDVWFHGPDGFVWHGTQYGEWTQIVHCKRTKERTHGAA